MAEDSIERLEARLRAQRAAIEEDNKSLQAQVDRTLRSMPRKLGFQNDVSNPKDIGVINQWDAGGTIIYTRQSARERPLFLSQIPSLAARVIEQRGQFDALTPEEQGRIRNEFTTSPSSAASTPYSDLLRSETLGQKYQQLQQARSPRQIT